MATKEIIKLINQLEEKIDTLEKKEKELEENLADEKVYSDPQALKETTSNFNHTKIELETAIEQWQKLSEELANIEKQFN